MIVNVQSHCEFINSTSLVTISLDQIHNINSDVKVNLIIYLDYEEN